MLVLARRLLAHVRDDVAGHELALAHRVLSVRHAVAADALTRQVGDRAHVTGAPGVLDDRAIRSHDAQVGEHAQTAALLDRQVGVADERGWP